MIQTPRFDARHQAGAIHQVRGARMLAAPGAGILAVIWLIGAYAIAFGVLLFVVALRLRAMRSGPVLGRA